MNMIRVSATNTWRNFSCMMKQLKNVHQWTQT